LAEKMSKLPRSESLIQLGADLPKGVIVMWHGNRKDMPRHWHECDGTEGTPDLLTFASQMGLCIIKKVK